MFMKTKLGCIKTWYPPLLVLVLIVTFGLSACSDDDVDPPTVSFGEIVWPQRYYPSAPGSVEVRVNVDQGASGLYVWAHAYSISDPNFPEQKLEQLYSSGYPNVFLFDLNRGEGRYRIRVGLQTDHSKLYFEKDALTSETFQVYSGADWYKFDANVEYSIQGERKEDRALDFLHWDTKGNNDFAEVTSPYAGTKVNMVVKWSPKNAVPREVVDIYFTELLEYRKKTAGYWDPGTYQRPKFDLLLCSVAGLKDYYELDWPGASLWEYKISLVNTAKIIERYSSKVDRICYYSAAHELAHLIGKGIKEYCDPPAGYIHDENDWGNEEVCLMTWIGPDPNGVPLYNCGSQTSLFRDEFHFCSADEARLNNSDFLLSIPPNPLKVYSADSTKELMYVR